MHMENLPLLYLQSQLPSKLVHPLFYYAACKIPFQRFSKHDFELCMMNCARHISRFYRFKITRDYLILLKQLVKLICELFSHRTHSTLAKRVWDEFLSASPVPYGYSGIREKPPPNSTLLLSSQAVNSL